MLISEFYKARKHIQVQATDYWDKVLMHIFLCTNK